MFYSTANNARNSPLLSLPPEIRSRIWDYVFDVGVIHVTSPLTRGHAYELSICRRPEMYAEAPSRIVEERDDGGANYLSRNSSYTHDHEHCLWTGTRKPFDRLNHLSLLQTCRLIYHEAVLKPFSVNGFQINTWNPGHKGKSCLHRMIDMMVPMQARAIKRLHIVSIDASFLSPVVVRQLKGLELLSIQIVANPPLQYFLDCFPADTGVLSLRNLSLKSLRIGFCLLVKPHMLQSVNTDTAAITTRIKNLEDKLLNGTMKAEDGDLGQVE